MTRVSLLLLVSSLAVVLSSHGVHGKNYLLQALGLGPDHQQKVNRELRWHNAKVHARIAENRLRRREDRRDDGDRQNMIRPDNNYGGDIIPVGLGDETDEEEGEKMSDDRKRDTYNYVAPQSDKKYKKKKVAALYTSSEKEKQKRKSKVNTGHTSFDDGLYLQGAAPQHKDEPGMDKGEKEQEKHEKQKSKKQKEEHKKQEKEKDKENSKRSKSGKDKEKENKDDKHKQKKKEYVKEEVANEKDKEKKNPNDKKVENLFQKKQRKRQSRNNNGRAEATDRTFTSTGGFRRNFSDNARARVNQHRFERKEKNHEQKRAAANSGENVVQHSRFKKKVAALEANLAGESGGNNGGLKRNHKNNARAREKQTRFERKVANHQAHLAAEADETQGRKGRNRRHQRNIEKAKEEEQELHAEKRFADHEASVAATVTVDVAQDGDGGIQRNQKDTALAREKTARFNKKRANHQAHQAAVADAEEQGENKRNHSNTNAREREQENHYEAKRAHHVANKQARNQAREAPQENHPRRHGFNKRKQERIWREHEGLPRKNHGQQEDMEPVEDRADNQVIIDAVTLSDGGSDAQADALTIDVMSDSGTNAGVAKRALSAATMYWIIFNNPEACSQRPCPLDDMFDENTKASMLHGTGDFTDENGHVTLVASLYRTTQNGDYSGEYRADGLAVTTSGALSSPGFYNENADVILGIRSVPVEQDEDDIEQMLQLTDFANENDALGAFAQLASYSAGEDGFGVLLDKTSREAVSDSTVHLVRQNDALQAYVETRIVADGVIDVGK